MQTFNIKTRLIVSLSFILLLVFVIISALNYSVSRKSIRGTIIQDSLPLISSNIYSELQSELMIPIHVSSLMASDTFLKDWITEGEVDITRITDYLNAIKNRYGFVSVFFVSEKTKKYYHFKGLHKVISNNDSHDVWYYDFLKLNKDYDLDVDTDEAANNELTIFINHRLLGRDGKLLGVAGVGLSMKNVGSMLDRYRKKYRKEIFFVDSDGLVQIHQDKSKVHLMNIFKADGIGSIAKKLLSSKNKPVIGEYKIKGERSILISLYIPEFDWFIIVEQIESRALKGIRGNFIGNMLIGFSVTLVVIFINILTVNYFQNRLITMATTDELTGVFNRRTFMEMAVREFSAFLRFKRDLSLLIVDVDHFKSINDRFGHAVGDSVLRLVTESVKSQTRGMDVFARIGGEEFALLLPYADEEKAWITAERLRKAVEEIKTPGLDLKVTISIGIAIANEDVGTLEALMKKADEALYTAKKSGRNLTVVYMS